MREPSEVRAFCAANLAGIETSRRFTSLLACLLGEDWRLTARSSAGSGSTPPCREEIRHRIPWYRLLRHEVEALVREKNGADHLQEKKLQKELADLNKEARVLATRLKAIDRRRAELEQELGG